MMIIPLIRTGLAINKCFKFYRLINIISRQVFYTLSGFAMMFYVFFEIFLKMREESGEKAAAEPQIESPNSN